MSAERRTPDPQHDAIVLAGGRGERLGGQDKALLEVGGRSLLDRVLDATAAAGTVVVVGAPRPGIDGVHWTCEEPSGGGPVAGIVAGLQALDEQTSHHRTLDPRARPAAPWVLVLAVDQPGVASVVPQVLDAVAEASAETEVLCPLDGDGHPQWLLAAYRQEALARACATVGTGHGVSVRRLVGDLVHVDVPGVREYLGDVDTWAEHQAWQRRLTS